MTAQEFERTRDSCNWALTRITWKNNATVDAAQSRSKALLAANNGMDPGHDKTRSLAPQTMLYHEWMQYAHLLTILYNRDRAEKRFTILRKGCMSMLQKMFKQKTLFLNSYLF